MNVLIVEENSLVLDMLGDCFGKTGAQVYMANSVTEALNIVRGLDESIDLLVADADLKPISGPELVLQLRGDSPEMKVVFITETPWAELNDRLAAIPACTFVRKPFHISAVTQAASALMGADLEMD